MKRQAILWKKENEVDYIELDIIEPKEGELLLENRFSLVSRGTEREWLATDHAHFVLGTTFPFVPGYSFAGYVAKVGENVENWNVGDAVFSTPLYGAHASHLTVPVEQCYKIPEGVRLEDAVYGNIGMTAVHTIRLTNVSFGKSIAIIGQGAIGHMAIQVAKARGAYPIVAFSSNDGRRRSALEAGADIAVDLNNKDEIVKIKRMGISCSIDLSGLNSGMNLALDITEPLGTVVFSSGNAEPQLLDYASLFTKGLTVIGSFVNVRMNEQREDINNFLWMLSNGTMNLLKNDEEIFAPSSAIDIYRRILENDNSLRSPMFQWNEK